MKNISNELENDFFEFTRIWENSESTNIEIYQKCYNRSEEIEFLHQHFVKTQVENDVAFAELAFRYFWLLVLNQVPSNSNILEIGVFKGATVSLMRIISNLLNKKFKIHGLTPLNSTGDKFSKYKDSDFLSDIEFVHKLFNLDIDELKIYKGLSIDNLIKDEVKEKKFQLVYVDGGHDYQTVLNDIELTDNILEVNGFMITDDSSSDLFFPRDFIGFRGHPEVNAAILDSEIIRENYLHLFACGHIRCWKKIK